jgi:hypothetical protein
MERSVELDKSPEEKAGSRNSFINESQEKLTSRRQSKEKSEKTSKLSYFGYDFHPLDSNLRRSSARLSTNLRLLRAGEEVVSMLRNNFTFLLKPLRGEDEVELPGVFFDLFARGAARNPFAAIIIPLLITCSAQITSSVLEYITGTTSTRKCRYHYFYDYFITRRSLARRKEGKMSKHNNNINLPRAKLRRPPQESCDFKIKRRGERPDSCGKSISACGRAGSGNSNNNNGDNNI